MTPFIQSLQAKKCFGRSVDNKKEMKPIAKVSEKRKPINREYAKVSRPVWKGKPCQIRSPVCTKHAEGFNHAAGKETKEKLLDIANGQASCNACNGYCEKHHDWAVRNGFRTKRNTKFIRNENGKK